MKYYFAVVMLIVFSVQPTIAATRTHITTPAPNPYRQMVSIQKIITTIVQTGKYGRNPSQSSISFKNGTKTIHFIVYHRQEFAYRLAVSIIEPIGNGQYSHISLVDMVTAKGQSLDGYIETVSKDEIRVRDGKVVAISNIQIEKKVAQRMFEQALNHFSSWSEGGARRLVIK